MTLHIPDIAAATETSGTLGAALAYAEAGWYILPVNTHTKNPGSIVGDGWPSLSSRDPQTITSWFAGTNHGIALHVGRSGAVILDVDNPEHAPDEVLLIIESDGPYQSTRPNKPRRGHYLLLNDTGRRIGNSLGKLATTPKWGEIRGANGVIIAAPSHHPENGHYKWVRGGPVPSMPDFIAEALPESSTPENTATDTEREAFLNRCIAKGNPAALEGLKNALQNKLDTGHSCHMSTLGILTDAMAEAAAGLYPARAAANTIWPIYRNTATTGTSTGRTLTEPEALDQYKGILSWAIGQATETKAAQAQTRTAQKYGTTYTLTADDVHTAAQQTCGNTDSSDELEQIENGFWDSRNSLKLIYTAALSQMCAPWAVLACCTARALAQVPPTITLPPIIGGPGSLNWFGAIVAKSGGGKGAASAVANQLIPWTDPNILTRGAGSGEGMIEAYQRSGKDEDNDITSVLFSVDEVDSLASLKDRSGQTTMTVIRSGFSGENLGFSYRGRSGETVQAHTYRMTMIIAVQPERAGSLFADTGGGTPQRFMWFPGRDRRITLDNIPEWPGDEFTKKKLHLPPPKKYKHGHQHIPDEAAHTIREARAASMSGDDNALDGHALFCREKFAYALAVMDGRTEMTSEDWQLSGIASNVSDWCRLRAQATLEAALHRDAQERGWLRGVQMDEAEIAKVANRDEAVARVLTRLLELLRENGGRWNRSDLRKNHTASRDRARFDAAVDLAVFHGLVKQDEKELVLL